ncbi:hypothetical protein TFLX_02593 [Thermoflexales bacterium]|nr:hypothetical protein TFLX_02593 [Thermoflexales bacterium]
MQLLKAATRLKRQLFAVMILLLVLALATSMTASVAAQQGAVDDIWREISERAFTVRGERWIIPAQYRTIGLNQPALRRLLASAPLEANVAAQDSTTIIALPLPDGSYGRFSFVESPIMESELAAKFPEIKTYAGQGLDDKTATARFDWTPAGFHALILSADSTVFIDPYSRNDMTHYISYYTQDYQPVLPKAFAEILPETPEDLAMAREIERLRAQHPDTPVGSQLRTYRLALAATGEYTQFHGGTVVAGLAAIVTSVNRVDGVYEREVAVRMVLVANNNLLVYTNAATDPYTNSNGSTMLGQNQTNVDAVIGDANYDVGHVFSTGGGGVAYLGVPCRSSWKARGVTGSPSPVGDPYDIDYVAHEMGHQFGANHTFNGNVGSCSGGNRNASTAYEPGSASTIMGYAGICGAQDLQPHSDDYFHTISFDEMVTYTNFGSGNNCPVVTATGNSAPVPDAGPGGYTIPAQTPFTLTGSATDPDGDPLTYNWEEFDLGTAGAPNNPTNPPFFRSFNSTTGPARTFPKWTDILNNTTTIGEILPNVTRALTFRLTVRDNRSGGGGVDRTSATINVTTAAGPFQVTAPNTALTWAIGSTQNVTWNVANTNLAPVNCSTVNVLLSTDGGFNYPITLASGVANNGTAAITVPNNPTTQARVQVACASNIFFDVSNANFVIQLIPLADLSLSKRVTPTTVANGDLVTYTLTITNTGPDAAVNVVLSDVLPLSHTFRSLSVQPGWTCTTPVVGSAGLVRCTQPSLAVGNAAFTLVAQITGVHAVSNTIITNQITATASTLDPTLPNSASASVTVSGLPLYRVYLPVVRRDF